LAGLAKNACRANPDSDGARCSICSTMHIYTEMSHVNFMQCIHRLHHSSPDGLARSRRERRPPAPASVNLSTALF
jgi:hypothetical protein